MKLSVYTVQIGNEGCSTCGHLKTWDIVGPDGIAEGISYGCEIEAGEYANALNAAYIKGINLALEAAAIIVEEKAANILAQQTPDATPCSIEDGVNLLVIAVILPELASAFRKLKTAAL